MAGGAATGAPLRSRDVLLFVQREGMLVTMSQSRSRAQEIVDTTLDLIGSRGIGRLTTAALARRLGFTEAALYRYYTGKGAILAAALQQVAESVFASMPSDLAANDDGDSGTIERQLGTHLRRFTAHQGVLLDLLLAGTTSGSGELQEAGNAFLEEYFYRVIAFFERAAKTGLIANDHPPRELASAWMCQLLGGFVRARLTLSGWNPEHHESYRSFLARFHAANP
jgi:AcrR family transcriptional regulator